VATRLREIKIDHHLGLDLYRNLDGASGDLESVMQLGSRVGGEHGTSDAELVPSLCRLLSDGGVDCRWMVLDCDDARYYEAGEMLADMLHGLAPDGDGPGLEERRAIYDGVLEEAADELPSSPSGKALLKELAERPSALPPEVARRVHVVRLPVRNRKENALIINALQRLATVVVQNSLQHGFGLTVTEALWKGAPVVASNVGGIGHQIRSGIDGTLIDDPRDPASVSAALLEVLADRRGAEARSRSGHRRVAENFMILQHVHTLLGELEGLIQGAGALRPRPVNRRRDDYEEDERFEAAHRSA
jgi:glycosyltransferase involved in cell wall biosynthesis